MDAPILTRLEIELDTLRRDRQANDPRFLSERLRQAERLLANSAFYMVPNDRPGSAHHVEQLVAFVMEGL